jgi:N-acetylglucosaminyl-diphospho-decaprenol L-rhamnosyltransferase
VKADAIVVAYRSAEILADCLHALRADSAVDRIVVVNNGRDQETGMVARRVAGTVFLQQEENVGFGRAVNAARPHLVSEFVVLANPDAVQSRSTTREALAFMAARERIGALGPRMLASDGSLFRNSQYDLGLLRLATQSQLERWALLRKVADGLRLQRWLGQQRSAAQHRVSHPTDYVIGSFMVCRRRALDQIGWFDESIFLFGEDQDLCRRMRMAGWEIWYAPVGQVTHSGGYSWRQLPDQGRAHFRQARYRELLRARGRLPAELYRWGSRVRDGHGAATPGAGSGGPHA